MLPSNRSVPEAGVFFQLELFQISSTFLTFYYFLLSFSTDDWSQRSLDSTNLLNLPESTPGLFSLVSFHRHPQKLYSLFLCLQTPSLISDYSSFWILLSSYTQLSMTGNVCMCFGFPYPSPLWNELFILEVPDLASNLNPKSEFSTLFMCSHRIYEAQYIC